MKNWIADNERPSISAHKSEQPAVATSGSRHWWCVFLVVFSLGMLGGCGVPCDQLAAKMCEDLGDADCKVWKDNGMDAFPGTGHKPMKSCINAFGSYERHLKSVKMMVEVRKKVAEEAAQRAKTPSLK